MSRFLFCSLFCFFYLFSSAQSIGSFLDFYLGQSITDVRRIVNSKYPSAEWNNNECTIRNVRLAGESFDNLFLKFQNNVLVSGKFAKGSTNLAISTSSYEDASNFVNYHIPQYEDMITRLYSQYLYKYGKETFQTNSSVVWRDSNRNSITIKLRKEVNYVSGTYLGYAGVMLLYEISENIGNY